MASSASRYRPPQQNAVPNASAPQPNRDAANTGGNRGNHAVAPNRTGEYRQGGGMGQASRQNEANQRFLSQPPRAAPAPQADPRENAAAATPRYRIPTAPERQPQSAAPSPQREYRGGMSSASRSAAPEMRAPPPRSESFRAAPNHAEGRSAPRNEGGGSYRGGGERAPQHQRGGDNGGGRGGGRGGESRER
jgi:hypothetical protein